MNGFDGDLSIDSTNRADNAKTGPRPFMTPRLPIPVMIRETPLSTKREREAVTPRFRRPAPKLVKTVPQARSILSNRKDTGPQLVTPHGLKPLESPKYDRKICKSFMEQVFHIEKIIGYGSFGEVFAVRSKEDSKQYAVKVSIAPMRQHSVTKYHEAVCHMIIPPHKNLVKFIRAWDEYERLYIQTELCDQSLLHYCNLKHQLPEHEVWDIFVDLLQAVDHLHSNDMIHDDIKPENIFLTKDMICKLGDFGLVINLKNPNDMKADEEGDSKYLAPEVLNGHATKSSDIFSLGMTILEATTDLDVPSSGDAWHQIRNGNIPDRFFVGISRDLRSLITLMLDSNPFNRPTSKDLLGHPAIKKRLRHRGLFIGFVEMRDSFLSFLRAILFWGIAFLWVVLHPIALFHETIKNRRSEICAQFVNKQQRPTKKTPLSSKVYSESLTGIAIRQQAAKIVSPFDVSDDENSPHSQHHVFTDPLSRRLNFEDSDGDDEQQATCSSSDSSAIDTVGEPSINSGRITKNVMERLSTSPSARRLFSCYRRRVPPNTMPNTVGASSTATRSSILGHAGSCNDFSSKSLMANRQLVDQERTNKYLRMRIAEQRLDWSDYNHVIDESYPQKRRKSLREMASVPKLNFDVLNVVEKPVRIQSPQIDAGMMSKPESSGDKIQ